jgi:colicin import membrane protein
MAAERRIAETAEGLAQTQEKLRKDQEAKEATGATSQEDFAEKRKQLETEAFNFRKKQEDARQAAESSAFRRSTLEQLIPARAETEAMRTSTSEQIRQAQERRKAEEAAAERAKQVGEAGTAGSKLAEALAGSANPAFVKQLAGASSSGDIGALIAMMEKLMANQRNLTDQQRSRLQKLEAEIEDLRTAK